MAKLDKAVRDDLTDDDYAVPGKKKLLIPDEEHVRLAWDMVDRTQGLTSAERSEARSRILRKARELGLDTSSWNKPVKAMQFQAASLDVPVVKGHPNKVPFSGVMTHVDQPSDAPPDGSGGKRVILPKAVAEAALDSLLGMAIDMTYGLNGHDPQNKIGIITSAEVVGNDIQIAGFFYGADFPDEVEDIKASTGELGFSYEALCSVEDVDAHTVKVVSCFFTGAAVLKKKDAAYKTTSITAKETKEMTPEEMKKLLEAALSPIQAQVAELATKVSATEQKQLEASAVTKKVAKHSKALRDAADEMERDGVGMHASGGHVVRLRKMADRMDAEAAEGQVPHIYRDHDWFSHSSAPVVDEAAAKQLSAVQEQIAALQTAVKQAGASPQPERRTLSAASAEFLSKFRLEAPSGDAKLAVETIDKALEAAGVRGTQAMAAKLRLQKDGLL